ncbi:MAG TPA: MarR family transcriptional regulator [Streptosporangiaceae bacterium]|nr:MarR family transcriptional regulator [Streptosporangiaceae bacterium]
MNARTAAGVTPDQAAEVSAGLERLFGLLRWLSPAGLSLTAAATLTTLDRSGPMRLTALAAGEGVTQPAMTQLIARLSDAGLTVRRADPDDGRVVHVHLTDAGRELVASRRATRAERLAGLLATLSQADQDALVAALPAINALASARIEQAGALPVPAGHPTADGSTQN